MEKFIYRKMPKKILTIAIVLLVLVFSSGVFGQSLSWFDDESIRCIVLLEKNEGSRFIPHGTGFLLFNYEEKSTPIVVTNKHLLRRSDIFVVIKADTSLLSFAQEFNNKRLKILGSIWNIDGPNLRLHVKLKRDLSYASHDSLDIGAFPIQITSRFPNPQNDSLSITFSRVSALSRSSFRFKENSKLGDEVFFVGFPFGIGTERGLLLSGYLAEGSPNPLVRSGSIAWKSDNSSEFLLDAFSYGGNSGSPIFTKRILGRPRPYLIGMIFGHLGTKQENFGLARCVWLDDILKVVELAEGL